jgi:hypothetical protein
MVTVCAWDTCSTGDPGAIDNLNASFPISTQQHSQPYVLWPYTFDDPNGPLDGYLQLPASWFEPLFGAYWAISNQTAPLISSAGSIGNALHMQNVDAYFPGIAAAVSTNPLSPVRPQLETMQKISREAMAPAIAPINAAILEVNRTIVSPASESIKQGSEALGSALAPVVNIGFEFLPNLDAVIGRNAPLPSLARNTANAAITTINQAPATSAALRMANSLSQAAASISAASVPPDIVTPAITSAINSVGQVFLRTT